MKTLFKLLIPAFLFVFFSSSAQEFSLETNSNEDYKLKIENINAKIAVNTHEGNELIIKAEGYTAPTAKAEGLNILRQNGLENTSIGLVVNEIDNNIIISGGNKTSEDLSYEFILPKNMSLSVVNTGFYLGLGMTTTGVYDRLIQYVPTSEADIVITDTDEADEIALEEEKKKPHLIIKNVSKEVEISYLRGSIMMENVTGPIVAKTDYGDIKISFSEVINQESPMSILCNNGDM